MARTKLTMRQIQEILRLKNQNQLSVREIARSCGLPTSTVGDYLTRAEAAGIGWPLPEGLSEKELFQLLIAHPVAGTAGCPALPTMPFELANWFKAKVNINYHVAVEKHFYSAPHPLIHQQLDVRLTDKTAELFQHGKRVAAHRRSHLPGRFTTLAEHRPKSRASRREPLAVTQEAGPRSAGHR